MMSHFAVYAVVVTYKRKEMLAKVIASLDAQTYPLKNVIIVDNNSQDGTEDVVASLAGSLKNVSIDYYDTGSNLGGAGGFEFGFRQAESGKYDFLWLMDDDLSPESDCLEKLVSATVDAGIVQPMRFNLDGTCAELSPVEYDLKTPWRINPKIKTVVELAAARKLSEPFIISGIPFEGPLISRQVISTIGFPNPNFFIFNDDLDYAIRAKNAGFKVVCQPSAKAVRLLVNNQKNDLLSWKGYFMLRNHFYILRSYGETSLVRIRPFLLAPAFSFLNLIKGRFSLAKICIQALVDSKRLSNNHLHKPRLIEYFMICIQFMSW